jgi:hypothetical protein
MHWILGRLCIPFLNCERGQNLVLKQRAWLSMKRNMKCLEGEVEVCDIELPF